MKKLVRVLRWVALAGMVTTLAAWVSGGWVVTPLVYGHRDPSARSARAHLEFLGEVLVTTTTDGIELTGVHAPSDEGAPVVLHLLESGVALAEGRNSRDSFRELSREGFASVAFDYRGVGLSGGTVDAGALLRDAEAMWRVAVALAGGDSSHVILRGCSLGSIVVTMLLEAGHRPGAIIAVAPVEAVTVAPRYGKLFMWDPLVWLAQPFLRPVTRASTVETFASSGIPAFAHVHPADGLLNRREYGRWLEIGQPDGQEPTSPCCVWVRDGLDLPHVASVPGLQVHLNLAMESYGVAHEERTFLASALPWYDPLERRTEALVARADPALAAEIAEDPEAYRRAQSLCAEFPDAPANAALVAALQLTDAEFAAAHRWIRGPWTSGAAYIIAGSDGESSPPGPSDLSVHDLREIFNLDHGGGRIPVEALMQARMELCCRAPGKSERAWTLERLLTVHAALAGDLAHPGVWFEVEPGARPGPVRDVPAERDHVLFLKRSEHGVGLQLRTLGDQGTVKRIYWMDRIADALGFARLPEQVSWEGWKDEEVELMVRCMRQAAWVVE